MTTRHRGAALPPPIQPEQVAPRSSGSGARDGNLAVQLDRTPPPQVASENQTACGRVARQGGEHEKTTRTAEQGRGVDRREAKQDQEKDDRRQQKNQRRHKTAPSPSASGGWSVKPPVRVSSPTMNEQSHSMRSSLAGRLLGEI